GDGRSGSCSVHHSTGTIRIASSNEPRSSDSASWAMATRLSRNHSSSTGLGRWAEAAQPRSTSVLLERVRLVEHASPPVQTAVELDMAIDDLRVRARVDHHAGPACEHLLAVSEQP